MARKHVRAEARIRKSKDRQRTKIEGRIPAQVRRHLGASEGDVLVFELGDTFVAERAAVAGPYFVVTRRRAPSPTAATPEATPAEPAPAIESLEQTINRLRKERRSGPGG